MKANQLTLENNQKIKTNHLCLTHPEIAKKFHPTKNGELLVTTLTKGSNRRVWWQCSKGHDYEMIVRQRVNGYGCPICRKQNKLNLFVLSHPEVIKEFHPTKNEESLVTSLTKSIYQRVWWQCQKGHEFQMSVYNRTRGCSCPVCRKEQNNLALLHPELMSEFHPTKNGELLVHLLTTGSDRRVWWQCSKGHDYEMRVNRRIERERCPICRKENKPNNLTLTHPELTKEFHSTKNGDLSVATLTKSSQKKVWWQCTKGHDYEMFVKQRVNGYGCPICRKEAKQNH